MSRVLFSPGRVGLIAHHTLREAARQKIFHFLGILAFAVVVGAQYLRDLNFGSAELKFVRDFGLGAMAFFGSTLAIVVTAQLFFSEIETRTVLTLLAKPVGRAEFIAGKFLGGAALLAVFCAGLTVAIAVVLWSREAALRREIPGVFAHGGGVDYGHLAVAGGLQWLKFVLLSALVQLVASFARTQLFTVAIGFGVLVVCHIQYLAQAAAARAGTVLSRVGAGAIALLFPNFQVFDFENFPAESVTPGRLLARVALYAVAYTCAVGALTVFSFRRREI